MPEVVRRKHSCPTESLGKGAKEPGNIGDDHRAICRRANHALPVARALVSKGDLRYSCARPTNERSLDNTQVPETEAFRIHPAMSEATSRREGY